MRIIKSNANRRKLAADAYLRTHPEEVKELRERMIQESIKEHEEQRKELIAKLHTIIDDLEKGCDGFMYLYYELIKIEERDAK